MTFHPLSLSLSLSLNIYIYQVSLSRLFIALRAETYDLLVAEHFSLKWPLFKSNPFHQFFSNLWFGRGFNLRWFSSSSPGDPLLRNSIDFPISDLRPVRFITSFLCPHFETWTIVLDAPSFAVNRKQRHFLWVTPEVKTSDKKRRTLEERFIILNVVILCGLLLGKIFARGRFHYLECLDNSTAVPKIYELSLLWFFAVRNIAEKADIILKK